MTPYDSSGSARAWRRAAARGRIAVLGTRDGDWSDHEQMRAGWCVAECVDGDQRVEFLCHRDEMPFLLAALDPPERKESVVGRDEARRQRP